MVAVPGKARLHGALCEFFEIEKRGSSVATEVRAGLTTFLTMSYILLVNPQILAQVLCSVYRGRVVEFLCPTHTFLSTPFQNRLASPSRTW